MPQETKICPECGARIAHLKYECCASQWGREWGKAGWEGDPYDCDGSDFDDGETSEYEFFCPECEAEIGTIDSWEETQSEEDFAQMKREKERLEAEKPRDLETEPTGPLYEKGDRDQDNVIITCRGCRYQWEHDDDADDVRKILDNPRKKNQILCPRCETRARKQDVVFV